MIHRVSLVLVEPKRDPDLPPLLAELEADELDYLQRHVETLRSRATDVEAQHSRFQAGSDVPQLLQELLSANDDRFLEVVGILATRLAAQMAGATTPNAGILSIVTSGDTGRVAEAVSILKLDATREAAQFRRLAHGKLQLRVLKELLPSPNELQKGIFWPDSRKGSDAIIRDRNVEAARYFLNAFQLQVAAKATDAEKTVLGVIAQLPDEDVPRAYVAAAGMSGPADTLVARLKEDFAQLDTERPALGSAGNVAGTIRPNKLAARGLKLKADGIEVHVPPDQVGKVKWRPDGDGYVILIEVGSKPRWAVG